ncbi:MAG: hypothetical protein K1X28_00445 [Parachlamydiales bacterium]|nr:hypothetical protein [Parachlamydiales bacterium]
MSAISPLDVCWLKLVAIHAKAAAKENRRSLVDLKSSAPSFEENKVLNAVVEIIEKADLMLDSLEGLYCAAQKALSVFAKSLPSPVNPGSRSRTPLSFQF